MLGRWRSTGSMLVVLVAAVVSVTGCGKTSTAASQAQDQLFLSEVHDSAPDVATYRNDTQLVRLGHAACDGFRSGVSYEEVANRLPLTEGSDPLPAGDLGVVITSAVTAFCPQYHNRVS